MIFYFFLCENVSIPVSNTIVKLACCSIYLGDVHGVQKWEGENVQEGILQRGAIRFSVVSLGVFIC